jgi:hypothetical protein
MFILFQDLNIASDDALLLGLPESLGVLAFGLGFTSIAVLMRRVFDKHEGRESTENTGKEV